MAKPCAVFWDIKHVECCIVECCIQHAIPKKQSVTSIVNLIRTTIIQPHNLSETSFFWVGDSRKLSSFVCHSLTALDVDIVHAYNGIQISADIKIMDLMRKFARFAGQDCTIILLSGNATYCDTLTDLKRLHNVSIHLVRLADSCSSKLDQISDYTFMLTDGVLMPVKSTGSPKYFISIENYPYSSNILIMNELNGQTIGSIEKSAIFYDLFICIGFPTLWNAERAIEQLNGSQIADETFLKVELLVDSPLTEILKCLNHNVTKETETYNEVKQLTFIKMNSNKTDIRFIIKFISACTGQSSSQCILLRKPFLWIVFAFKSDAEKFLPKLQEMYPDAIISESPIDLALAFHENPYTVESCKLKVTDETTSDFEADNCNVVKVKPELAMQVNSQYQSSSIKPAVDIHLSAESKASNESVETIQEPQNLVNRDLLGDNGLNMFFRYHSHSIPDVLDVPSVWSLLYNLFEKLYDLGAEKVFCNRYFYCAHFDSASAYQEAFERMRSCYLDHLKFVNVSELSMYQINSVLSNFRHISGIPWCLNEELGLCCLRVKIKSKHHADFIEMSKNILRNQECIFIKSLPGEIWIGFPDEIICENSKKRVDAVIACCTHKNDVSMVRPSNELLESINFHDLAGDAYDLAFLSRLLEGSDSIDRPNIIERISLQRMKEKECNEGAYHIEVQGYFDDLNFALIYDLLSLSQIVKIFNFSKVIPLAATASRERVELLYYSFYEAEFARYCINQLKSAEVPYFKKFRGVPSVVKNISFSDISEYYIINDQRKVLEKIVKNKSLVDKVDSNSSTVQSTSDIDAIDRKLKFLFVVTANSEFKLTSRIISIIKMHLVDWECPACIEFEDKVWFGFDDLKKGNTAKARIEKIKFKLLHENDEDDFNVGVVAKFVSNCPLKVVKMLDNKLVNSTKTHQHMHTNWYLDNDAVPLGHFNYNYRKAVGISASRYFKSIAAL